MSDLIHCWLHVLNSDVRVSALDGLFVHLCSVCVSVCFAWSFILVCKARCFSQVVCSLISFIVFYLFGNQMFNCGMLLSHTVYGFVFSQVLFVLCCWGVLMLRNSVRHDSRLSWIVPLLSCRCRCISCL